MEIDTVSGVCQKCNQEKDLIVATPLSVGLTHLKLCSECREEKVFCQMCDTQIEWFEGMKYKDIITEVDADWPYILCEDCCPNTEFGAVEEYQQNFDTRNWEEINISDLEELESNSWQEISFDESEDQDNE